MGRPKKGYELDDGTKVAGVTSILNRWKDCGPLIYWGCEQGKAIQRGEIQSLYDKRDEAANIGTIAHEMCDAYLKGEDDPLFVCGSMATSQETADKATQAFNMFLHWWETNGLEVYASEIPLVSEQYRFGGTPDWVLKTKDGLAIGDIKTSKALYRDMLMQVAAYKQLWEENRNEPITGGFYVCRFSKDFPDWEQRYFGELDDAWEEFKLLARAYELDKQLKKRIA